MTTSRLSQTRLSAIWAAYGDALGFITELADADRVQYRSGKATVTHTIDWRRTLGYRTGRSLILPAGTYSDDTQLRLSTSRSIRSDGTFDVASFAKVELTAWANYALGAGVGTREAASNLARTSATWYSNFFDSKKSSYVNGGGNGAAMRIQPHVWAARNFEKVEPILLDVVRNAISTHGHPRGILGACFHAATLAKAMADGRPPSISAFEEIAKSFQLLPDIINGDNDLRLFWFGSWLDKIGETAKSAFESTINEMLSDINSLNEIKEDDLTKAYDFAVDKLEARLPTSRGSGTKTALLAAFLASRCNLLNPNEAIGIAANNLGSDTDSIASMAGAIIGACTETECESPIQDRGYIESEASRLAAVAERKAGSSFRYPDLRTWKPARAAIDAIASAQGQLILDGVGQLASKFGPPVSAGNDELLQWFELDFGQTILARVREKPRSSSHQSKIGLLEDPRQQGGGATPKLPNLFSIKPHSHSSEKNLSPNFVSKNLNETLQKIIESGFDPELIGAALLAQVHPDRPDFVERGIALSSTILTAYQARQRKRS